jgi:hypothetical protein
VVGGTVGYTTYYNVLYSKALPLVTAAVVQASIEADVYNLTKIEEIGALLAVSLNEEILPLVGGN